MKENRKLLKEVLKDIRHDMTDEEVLNLLAGSKISINPAAEKEKYTIGQRSADAIARFAGSWAFIFSFTGILILWMVVNTLLAARAAISLCLAHGSGRFMPQGDTRSRAARFRCAQHPKPAKYRLKKHMPLKSEDFSGICFSFSERTALRAATAHGSSCNGALLLLGFQALWQG